MDPFVPTTTAAVTALAMSFMLAPEGYAFKTKCGCHRQMNIGEIPDSCLGEQVLLTQSY